MSSESQNHETIEELHEKLNEIGEEEVNDETRAAEVNDETGAAQLHDVLKSSGCEDDGNDEDGSVNQIQGTQNQRLEMGEQ